MDAPSPASARTARNRPVADAGSMRFTFGGDWKRAARLLGDRRDHRLRRRPGPHESL